MRFMRWLCQLSHGSRLKAGLQPVDPKRITAAPYRTPNQADSAESPATENGKLFWDDSWRGEAATKSSMAPRPVGAQLQAGGSCYEDVRKL
jgi:hypothetical protein